MMICKIVETHSTAWRHDLFSRLAQMPAKGLEHFYQNTQILSEESDPDCAFEIIGRNSIFIRKIPH